MTYTLTLCIGMWLATCGQILTFDYPTMAECERARDAFPKDVIGRGYAICAPRKEPTHG